jgi:single-strand DNA-binding protein
VTLRVTSAGQSVASFPVATNRVWVDKAGQKQEATEFHNIVVWGKQAELCNQYLAKGREVFIEGRLQTRSYQAQTGEKKYRTEIVCEKVQFGAKTSGAQESLNAAKPGIDPPPPESLETIDLEAAPGAAEGAVSRPDALETDDQPPPF